MMMSSWEGTNHRNLKFKISEKVKERLKEYQYELQIRRQKLYAFLEEETLMYQAEMELMLMKQEEEKERRRLDWINMHMLERTMAEEEFRKRKQLQREMLENSEAQRELESKKILLESKIAQVYQIEEKKALRRKDQELENYWLEISKREMLKKEKQAEYDEKLRKNIAKYEQEQNLKYSQHSQVLKRAQKVASQQETEAENQRTTAIDQKLQENEKINEYCKKMKQQSLLVEQIRNNRISQHVDECSRKQVAILERALDHDNIVKCLEKGMQEKLKNREWQKAYLAHEMEQKQLRNNKEKTLDEIFVGKACVLEQTNKKPYNKNVR